MSDVYCHECRRLKSSKSFGGNICDECYKGINATIKEQYAENKRLNKQISFLISCIKSGEQLEDNWQKALEK